jgi:dihydrofolate reductase
MRKIKAAVFQSLDGVMQAPGGQTEDPTGGFTHGGWEMPYEDSKTDAALGEVFTTEYDLLLGRRTYDIFAGYWPFVDKDNPVHQAFEKAAKYVVTRGLQPLHWQNSHRVPGMDGVRAAKATEGPDLFVWGSSTLIPQLLAEGLLDQLMVLTYPVILGGGKRLFGDGTPARGMGLTKGDVSESGVIIATYEPRGGVPTGTRPGPEPSEAERARQEKIARDDTW